MSTNSQTGQSRIPAQPSGEQGRLTLADLSAITGIPQHRLEFFFSGGVALTTAEEALLMPVLHREHQRFAENEKVDRG